MCLLQLLVNNNLTCGNPQIYMTFIVLYNNSDSSKGAQIVLENCHFFAKIKAGCRVSFSLIRTRSIFITTSKITTRTRITTTTFFHINTTRKPHIYGQTINNNQIQHKQTATPNKISKILFRVYWSGQSKRYSVSLRPGPSGD